MKFAFAIISVFISVNIFAQEISYENAEEIISGYYDKSQWNELINFGNKALDKGIDFYSLRLYLGIAYFKKEEYFDAIENFEKAEELSPGNSGILKYLYFCYLYTGRLEESNNIFFQLSDSEKKNIRPARNSFVNDAVTEAGNGFSNDESKNSNVNFLNGNDVFGEQTITKNIFYFNAGFNQIPFKLFSIFYGYTYLNRSKELLLQSETSDYSRQYSQIQNQFYNNIGIVADGFVITPAAHYLGIKSSEFNPEYDSITYVFNNSTMSYDSIKYYYNVTEAETNAADFVLSLSVSKFISKYRFSLAGSFSYLNNAHQSQIGIGFLSFPSGKINFFTNTVAVLHYQNSIADLIVTQYLGGQIGKKLQLTGYAAIGKIYNYNEQNGFIVYNDIDPIKNKFGAELKYFFSNYISANLRYEFQNREKTYNVIEFSGIQNNSPVLTRKFSTLGYSVNAIAAGLKFIF